MLESFKASDFAERRGETFRVHVDDSASFDTELVDITESTEGREGNFRRPFALVFRGPIDDYVPQRIYRVEHAELGAFELFLVPIGPDEAGMRYEAVFG